VIPRRARTPAKKEREGDEEGGKEKGGKGVGGREMEGREGELCSCKFSLKTLR